MLLTGKKNLNLFCYLPKAWAEFFCFRFPLNPLRFTSHQKNWHTKKLSIFAKLQFFLARFKSEGIKRKFKTEKSSLGYWNKILICIFAFFQGPNWFIGSSHANDQSWILNLPICFNGLQYGFFASNEQRYFRHFSVYFDLMWIKTSNSC